MRLLQRIVNGYAQMNLYQHPMQPWPGLAPYARLIDLSTSGIRLFAYDSRSGDSPPFLLIHGLGDEADTWRYIFPGLSGERRVIAVDLPGFGRSDHPDRPYTLSFFQDTLLELLNVLELPRVRLVGHSLGAGIAQSIALDYRERVERLVLISGSLVSKTQPISLQTLLFLIPGPGEWTYNRLRRNPQVAYDTLKPYYNNLEALPQEDRDFLFQRVNERVWSDEQRQAFLSTLRNLARTLPSQQKVLPARLVDFQVPTLVIWGEADHINPIANAHALVTLQPEARLITIRNGGHNVHQERPVDVLEAISGQYPLRNPGREARIQE